MIIIGLLTNETLIKSIGIASGKQIAAATIALKNPYQLHVKVVLSYTGTF